MTKNRYLKDKSCATDLADDAILVNEVADTALNDRVPGCPSLAISELKSEAVEVIIPGSKCEVELLRGKFKRAYFIMLEDADQ